jgi:hypothetical protein
MLSKQALRERETHIFTEIHNINADVVFLELFRQLDQLRLSEQAHALYNVQRDRLTSFSSSWMGLPTNAMMR